jgi:arginyl-tRNA synthetase
MVRMKEVSEFLKDLLLRAAMDVATGKGLSPGEMPEVLLERPRHEGQGDWASNIAMLLAKPLKARPRELAEEIVSKIGKDPHLEKIEVAGPGFINFFVTNLWVRDVLETAVNERENFGRSSQGKGRKVQVEFVSANPTGPLHVGHGRGAAVGDMTASLLEYAGWEVEREYYINDAGLQMNLLGQSTQARYFELLEVAEKAPFPENGYKGDYIYDLAKEIIEIEGNRFVGMPLDESFPVFQAYAANTILGGIRQDLALFGVSFDVWFSEKSLYEKGLVESALDFLKQRGHAYDKDGALWFRTTAFGDDKDRVLVRSNGVTTYFASDVAYHKEKFDRGFDLVIDVWGADHHGYVPRMKAAVEALGKDREALQILLIQFVNLLRGGHQVSMSTRSGEFVTLREVLDEVGIDAARFFFAMRRCDSHLDFDLELAKKASTDNPVFYVQYANARIQSIMREAASRNIEVAASSSVDFSLLREPEEKALAKRIARFPEEVEKAAYELAAHRIAFFAYDLASDFHAFYNAHRVLGVEDEVSKARLYLVEAARVALTNALGILRVKAPERM